MKIRAKKAYAIVNKKKPQFNILDIYPNNKEVKLERDEKWVKVIIQQQ